MICHYFEEPSYLIFANDISPLLYYSHIPVMILSFLVGLFVFINNPRGISNRLLFLITLFFTGWSSINLLAWTNIHSDIILSIWPFFGVFSALISIFLVYFIYTFTHNKDAPLSIKVTLLTLLLPVFIFAHTNLSVSGFQISDCDAFGFEGQYYNAYYALLNVVSVLWSSYFLIKQYLVSGKTFKKQIILLGIGTEFFLITFSSITWLSSYLSNIGIIKDSDFEFYGMFGMAVFVVFLGVLISKFNTFKSGVLATHALLVVLVILVGSQLTFADSKLSIILTVITLFFTFIIGLLLIRSVNKEIKQNEQLQLINSKLENANDRLRVLDKQKSEFVSIASHQLRSPLTAIRGYVSLIEEGNFGQIPDQMREALRRISESGKFMAVSIDDFLNVSRIESGNMKYEYKDVNLREQAEHVVEDLRSDAIKRGLLLLFKSDLKGKGIVYADFGKTQQIIHNLMNNALKYTRKGTVTVYVHDDTVKNLIHVEFIDTGIGMSKDTLQKLFGKFARAKVASSANIMGTGLGLFVAREMARAMKGDITAYSDGEGQGSRFVFTIPYVM
jgi:signal transduction histidine kinase